MTRPTYLYIDTDALKTNVACVKQFAPKQAIIAMIKANAYGCGMQWVAPILEPLVDGFGVASIEEACLLRQFCPSIDCILFQGIFEPNELQTVIDLNLTTVIHTHQQLQWITERALDTKIKVWVKVDTGMHRLGFAPEEWGSVLARIKACAWINPQIGLMTHMACADQPDHESIARQLKYWETLSNRNEIKIQSIGNSASIIALPRTHATVVRPGIMLYGISPFEDNIGADFGLKPVMHFESAITAIHHYRTGETIGYGGSWQCQRPSIIAVVPVGYADGYPRHIHSNTPTWVNGCRAPVIGRVSMDMMTIDLTDCPSATLGDRVELWGSHIPIEEVARHANTIAYDLMCRVSQRVHKQYKRILK